MRYIPLTICKDPDGTVKARGVNLPFGNIDVSLRTTHYITRLNGGTRWRSAQYNAQLSGGFEVGVVNPRFDALY